MKRYLGDKMGMLSKLKERCYAFVHADVHPEFFPIDAWTDARYADWFERHRAKGVDLANQRGSRFSWEPTFSFIVPLYKKMCIRDRHQQRYMLVVRFRLRGGRRRGDPL